MIEKNSVKYDNLEYVLQQSGLDVALGRNQLFFKNDQPELAKGKSRDTPAGSVRSDTFNMSMGNSLVDIINRQMI
jgi:hypothetical protein